MPAMAISVGCGVTMVTPAGIGKTTSWL